MGKTHYDILKVSRDAPIEVIRAAYRVLSLMHHPDRHPEDPAAALSFFPDGLTTAEVALLLARGPDPMADLESTRAALDALVADGAVIRTPLGQDALWAAR